MKKYTYLFMSLAIAGLMFSCSDDDDAIDNDDTNERAELYVTNENNGDVAVYDMNDSGNMTTLSTSSNANEGVYYNGSSDQLYVASRSQNQVNVYSNISDILDQNMTDLELSFNSAGNLESPRKIASNGNIIVVADNADVDGDDSTADGRFFVFNQSNDGISLRNTITVNFAVWGITFNGNNLYAVVDQTSDLAIFNNFSSDFNSDGEAMPSKRITIEGIVRTHGIVYNNDDDMLVMTDIGSADSDSDGAFHVISNANSKLANVEDGGTLSTSEQVRVAGSNTFLGNPVDVHYNEDDETIYIAEVANGGGRVLSFTESAYTNGGNIDPAINNSLAGANSLYFYDQD